MPPPLLLLDVDGPLNPYAAKPHKRPEGYLTHRVKPDFWVSRFPRGPAEYVRPLRLWLNPVHGPELLALPYELVWATTWMDEANAWIAPLLGLPQLPFVDWPEPHREDPDGLHWKTRCLVARAAGRPFAWVDDELGPQDTAWTAAHHPGRALTLRIDPRLGLREGDFATLKEWAAV
ncbi:HAD domain-containing protein [Kitasatospora sp. NPDC088351]|uniref:HAD domain-containing protein n=1 Tax=unclassified Kitasatospora TaxID=2633591 RepID=UPI00342C45A3